MPGKWGEFYWTDFLSRHPDDKEGSAHPISTIRTHAHTNAAAPAGEQRYPVLLFAPGSGTTPLEYASLIEDVVSHGYIVAGVVSPYLLTRECAGRWASDRRTRRHGGRRNSRGDWAFVDRSGAQRV